MYIHAFILTCMYIYIHMMSEDKTEHIVVLCVHRKCVSPLILYPYKCQEIFVYLLLL